MNENRALEILKEVTLSRLGYWDGCWCTSCEIVGVHIGLSCHRFYRGETNVESIFPGYRGPLLRVYGHPDTGPAALREIAEEVCRQMLSPDNYYSSQLAVRFCDSTHDESGDTGKCTYCGKPRDKAEGYLCGKCALGVQYHPDHAAFLKEYERRYLDFIARRDDDTDELRWCSPSEAEEDSTGNIVPVVVTLTLDADAAPESPR